jgi:hypothetical protein
MRFATKKALLLCGVAALGVAGCKSTNSSSPTTMPAPETNMKMPGSTTMPVAAANPPPVAAAPAAKDMTHVLEKDQPYFTTEPGPSATPAGTLAMGSKVLVMAPGAPYSQVVTDKGLSAYTATDGLKPLGK